MKRKDIILILIPTFIFVIAWIGFSIWHNIVNSTISEVLNIQISPISPSFDTKTVDELKKRSFLTPIFETSATAVITATPTAVITAAPIASPSPELSAPILSSESGEATGGGTISP